MNFNYLFLTLGIPWAHSMPSCDVNTTTRLAEASWRRANSINVVNGNLALESMWREFSSGLLWYVLNCICCSNIYRNVQVRAPDRFWEEGTGGKDVVYGDTQTDCICSSCIYRNVPVRAPDGLWEDCTAGKDIIKGDTPADYICSFCIYRNVPVRAPDRFWEEGPAGQDVIHGDTSTDGAVGIQCLPSVWGNRQ